MQSLKQHTSISLGTRANNGTILLLISACFMYTPGCSATFDQNFPTFEVRNLGGMAVLLNLNVMRTGVLPLLYNIDENTICVGLGIMNGLPYLERVLPLENFIHWPSASLNIAKTLSKTELTFYSIHLVVDSKRTNVKLLTSFTLNVLDCEGTRVPIFLPVSLWSTSSQRNRMGAFFLGSTAMLWAVFDHLENSLAVIDPLDWSFFKFSRIDEASTRCCLTLSCRTMTGLCTTSSTSESWSEASMSITTSHFELDVDSFWETAAAFFWCKLDCAVAPEQLWAVSWHLSMYHWDQCRVHKLTARGQTETLCCSIGIDWNSDAQNDHVVTYEYTMWILTFISFKASAFASAEGYTLPLASSNFSHLIHEDPGHFELRNHFPQPSQSRTMTSKDSL